MDYLDQLIDQREQHERGDDPPFIIEPEDLLGLDAWEREGVDRHALTACAVQVDFIDASDEDTECATAGDTPLLLRIAVTDDITQRTNTIKE